MKSICIFCGSNWGNREDYKDAAIAISSEIARRGYTLVYGGAGVGLMGACADAALAQGGKVIGILPEALKEKEVDHKGLSELHLVSSMHERKAMMEDLSDGFISIPGGAGTMDEMFEIWTWGMLGWHDKPSALMNVAGYYDDLIKFLDKTAQEGFVRKAHRDMLIIGEEAGAILDQMEAYEPPQGSKWIKKKSET
ncbi:MAG: TIGR00730 family Rossman fold protein [Cohaesibacter sp.]|nr:TIGR00730 family Rossman fold protein [Cohaesibacter sp.]MCV6602176.1 TIGR00730 family Rossman fold protein [Cohaesibacter sp.]